MGWLSIRSYIHTSCSPPVASPRSPSNVGFLLVKDIGMVVVGSEFTSAAPLLVNIICLVVVEGRNMIVLDMEGSPLPELGT